MLVIAGTIAIDPAGRAEAVSAATVMMAETLKEPGCISYTFSGDLTDPGGFRIFEEWESQEALDAHFKAPHMAAFQAAIGKVGVREMKVKRYEIASVGPLGG
jgi:quinol monooxygenase YgiN